MIGRFTVVLHLLRGDPSADAAVPPSGATGHLTTLAAAAMAFLAVFALAATLAADRVGARWSGALSGIATLEVPASGETGDTDLARAELILSQTDGIADVRALSPDEVRGLLKPWLGDTDALTPEDLPRILAVDETADLDRAALAARLAGELPDAIYHRHERWSEQITTAASRIRLLAAVFLITAFAVTTIVVTLAARASLAIHGQVITTLSMLGARDSYIVRAFVRRFTLRGAAGGVLGTALGLTVLALLPGGADALSALLPVSAVGWLLFALIPLVTAALSFIATRRAALRVLRAAA